MYWAPDLDFNFLCSAVAVPSFVAFYMGVVSVSFSMKWRCSLEMQKCGAFYRSPISYCSAVTSHLCVLFVSCLEWKSWRRLSVACFDYGVLLCTILTFYRCWPCWYRRLLVFEFLSLPLISWCDLMPIVRLRTLILDYGFIHLNAGPALHSVSAYMAF